MNEPKQIYVPTREEWRVWLESHHDSEDEVWLIYYKKPSGKPRVAYNDAVEEAICFGWIDSTVRKIDEERYMQKFTPRNPTSVWSELNKSRAEKMIHEGRMTEAGLANIAAARESGEWGKDRSLPDAVEMPPELRAALLKNPTAKENFERFAPSYRRLYSRWVADAKREETREKRIRKVVGRAEKNLKPDINM
jgi:uncharacterized protein YdeI (YjbR/CyaY-like superfamily)